MRSATRLAGGMLLVAALTACDSEQPIQVETSVATLNITATNALSKTMDVWNLIEDNDNDGFPDDGKTYLWCEGPRAQTAQPISVPWGYSVEVSLIRAGSIEREVITSEDALLQQHNFAAYDFTSQTVGQTPSKPPIVVNGRVFKFSSPRRMPAARGDLMLATGSPLATLTAAAWGTGLCSPGNPGVARIDGIPLPASLELNKGDTIIVKASLSSTTDASAGLTRALVAASGSPGGVNGPTAIAGRLQIDGRSVNVQGSSSGKTFSFSYTIR